MDVLERTLESYPEVTLKHRVGNELTILLEGIETEIWVHLYPQDDKIWFDVSHVIHTPLQAAPYRTSRPFNDTYESALRQYVFGLVQYYREAVKKGHLPSEEWLVEYKS